MRVLYFLLRYIYDGGYASALPVYGGGRKGTRSPLCRPRKNAYDILKWWGTVPHHFKLPYVFLRGQHGHARVPFRSQPRWKLIIGNNAWMEINWLYMIQLCSILLINIITQQHNITAYDTRPYLARARPLRRIKSYFWKSGVGYALAIFDFGQNLKFIRIYGLARAIYGRVP